MRKSTGLKRTAVVAALALALLAAAGGAPQTDFEKMHDLVASYLMDPKNFPEVDQGVVSPEFGDAKVYCPAWIYLRDKSPQYKATERELKIADAMIDRYCEYFDRFEANPVKSLTGDFEVLMHVAIGIEGVYKACEHDPRPERRDLIRRYLDLMAPVARHPAFLYQYHVEPYGPVTVIAGAAWFYLSYPLTFGPDDEKSAEYRKIGLEIIDKLDRRLYREKNKKYLYSAQPGYDFTYVYNNAVMVQALVRAYVLTGEERYYRRGLDIMETVDRDLYNPGYKGWMAAEDLGKYNRRYKKIGPQYNREYMALSAHNYIAYACFALYEAGGFRDEALLDSALRALSFEQAWLWDGEGRIEHHIERGRLAAAEDYCAGCNFQTLYNVVLLKFALQKEPALGLLPTRN